MQAQPRNHTVKADWTGAKIKKNAIAAKALLCGRNSVAQFAQAQGKVFGAFRSLP
jgi:hypothetical protein